MPNRFLCLLGGLLCAACANAQSLHDYLASLKWDSEKHGPLIALDPSSVGLPKGYDYSRMPTDMDPALAVFSRKAERFGKLTAIVPKFRLAFTDSNAANPYDGMSQADKFVALLGSLDSGQWRKLTTSGLAPDDLSGWPRQILLSIIPHPFYAQEFFYDGGGYASVRDPFPIAADQSDRMRLQMFKALDVGFSPMVDSKMAGAALMFGVSSMIYRPPGAVAYRDVSAEHQTHGLVGAKVVANDEKDSDLNTRVAWLAKDVALANGASVGSLVAAVRSATGMEIYPDARISGFPVEIVGDHAAAGDLLQALALSVSGTYRRVGPAYVLAPDEEGQATRGARAQATAVLGWLQIQHKIADWRVQIKSGGLLDQLDFLSDDVFGGAAFLRAHGLSTSAYDDPGWHPSASMNPVMHEAIPVVSATQPIVQPGQTWLPNDALRDQVHYHVSIGYRFVMPDDTPLGSQSLDIDSGSLTTGGAPVNPPKLPMDGNKLTLGSAAGFRSDDPAAVGQFCSLAKAHGFHRVWIETREPKAVAAALDSGLAVDLVVRPWAMLPGEVGETDVNVFGQAGGDLNLIPLARMNFPYHQTWTFTTSFSPADPDLSGHWARLAPLLSTRGIRRLILMDAIPGGYAHAEDSDYDRIRTGPVTFNGAQILKSLRDLAPTVYEFGYTTLLRTAALRKFGIDPIDLEHPFRRSSLAAIPFFEEGESPDYPYPHAHLKMNGTLEDFVQFEQMRYSAALTGLKECLKRLAVGGAPIWLQYPPRDGEYGRSPICIGPASLLDDKYSMDRDTEEVVAVNPLTAENERGEIEYAIPCQLNKPVCFDFSDVPVHRLKSYFDYMFKPTP